MADVFESRGFVTKFYLIPHPSSCRGLLLAHALPEMDVTLRKTLHENELHSSQMITTR